MKAELASTNSSNETRIQKENCIITLDLPQYFFYQAEHIDLHDPNGNFLESIGHRIQVMETETTQYRLHEQICLVENLLGQINHDLELRKEAVSALADLLYQTQKVIEKMGIK